MSGRNLTSKRARGTLHIVLAFSLIGTASVAEGTLPAADWGGAYVGLTLGLAQSGGEAELGDYSGELLPLDVQNGLFPTEIDEMRATGLAGLSLGYNLQRGNFVGGVEADFSFFDHDQTHGLSRVDPNPNPIFNGQDTNTEYTTEFSNLMTLRFQGGYAQGRNLFFATAGLAAAEVMNEFKLDLPGLGYSSPDWSESGTLHGFVFGAGLERHMTERVRLKAEVMRFDLENVTIEARDPVTFPGESIDYGFQNSGTLARMGVNFVF